MRLLGFVTVRRWFCLPLLGVAKIAVANFSYLQSQTVERFFLLALFDEGHFFLENRDK